ncbi:YciI family protein [Dyadobacter arcticus]|uniref:YCII-related domain-containing protein n=1 Tax=Dyadobacter arcticus TaxID=1078754 RepID=A0ABX0UUR3_9BACT|nr:YciI family protein [Dyadobacter arcticus]NIJ56128.1 hypothetical protein [Dyadobacter arcticus]
MKEFALIFRNSLNPAVQPSPEQMQQVLTEWMNWLGGIAAQNKLVDRGNRLSISQSKTVRPDNVVTDGPYTELKEFINGYSIIKATDLDEAVAMAKGCPALTIGGNVEVRALVASEDTN